MAKNIIVIDEFGKEIGKTYPKRAKGLVKTGRALFVDDLVIRLLTTCPTENIYQEDNFTMNTITFNAREWKKNAGAAAGTTERSFMTVFDELKEVYAVGNALEEPSEIVTVKELEPNTDYSFVFWLSGGESEAYNETCQLQIIYSDGDFTDDENEDKSIYRLNRDYIKPVKKCKGWKLFCIPFNTEDKKCVQLKFVVANAEAIIMNAAIESEETAENTEATEEQDIMAQVTEYAKKFGTSAIKFGSKVGNKAVELGKKYKEPAKELGEKGIDGIKKGTEKIMNSETFKKIEETITNIVSPSKSEDAEEVTETTEATEATEAAETVEATEAVEATETPELTVAEESTEETTEE